MAAEVGIPGARVTARNAAELFGLDIESLRVVGVGLDWTFRVRARGGSHFAIRVGDATLGQTPDALRAETTWLHAVAAGTDLVVPQSLRLIDSDDPVAVVGGAGVTAVTWLPGSRSRSRVHTWQAWEIGRMIGAIHRFSRGWSPTPGFERKCWTPAQMTGRFTPVDAELEDLGARLGADCRSLVAAADSLVDSVAGDLAQVRGAVGMVHGALHPGNVLWFGRRGHLVDFNDSGWSLYAYDLALTLRSLCWRDRGVELVGACMSGYAHAAGELPVHWEEQQWLFQVAVDAYALRHYATSGARPETEPRALHALKRLQVGLRNGENRVEDPAAPCG